MIATGGLPVAEASVTLFAEAKPFDNCLLRRILFRRQIASEIMKTI